MKIKFLEIISERIYDLSKWFFFMWKLEFLFIYVTKTFYELSYYLNPRIISIYGFDKGFLLRFYRKY